MTGREGARLAGRVCGRDQGCRAPTGTGNRIPVGRYVPVKGHRGSRETKGHTGHTNIRTNLTSIPHNHPGPPSRQPTHKPQTHIHAQPRDVRRARSRPSQRSPPNPARSTQKRPPPANPTLPPRPTRCQCAATEDGLKRRLAEAAPDSEEAAPWPCEPNCTRCTGRRGGRPYRFSTGTYW